MRILVAPNSFKGTAGAVEVAQVWARRLEAQGFDVDCCPMADGGDGTMEVLFAARGGVRHTADVTGPLGGRVRAEWLELPDGTGFVEAAACGMRVLPPGGIGILERGGVLAATSRGVGELLAEAAGRCGSVAVGIGGTASTDGGAGALDALGVAPGGTWSHAGAVDLTLLCDVANPLLGPTGAAAVYGPQKGLDSEGIVEAEKRLRGFAAAWKDGPARAREEGTGAGGGLAFGLLVACGGRIVPGASFVADAVDLARRIREADVVVTGEGRFDATSLQGKAPGEVLRLATLAGKRAVVVTGSATIVPRGDIVVRVLGERPVADGVDEFSEGLQQ